MLMFAGSIWIEDRIAAVVVRVVFPDMLPI